jgi:hypothetical protein
MDSREIHSLQRRVFAFKFVHKTLKKLEAYFEACSLSAGDNVSGFSLDCAPKLLVDQLGLDPSA